MSHLMRIALKHPLPAGVEADRFPFSVPAVQTWPALDVDTPMTLFVGENGSGKSTLLEGIAAAAELPALGQAQVAFDDTLAPQRRLGAALRLSWSRRSRKGFFLRAEDFFGYLKEKARTEARVLRERTEAVGEVAQHDVVDGLGGLHIDERNAARFIAYLDARSHGESFMDLFTTRVHPGGLYLIDEPEAPLSPARQLALLGVFLRAAKAGAQFIVATHSPILLSFPGARIYSFHRVPVTRVAYEELEHVQPMRSFLADPDRYFRELK